MKGKAIKSKSRHAFTLLKPFNSKLALKRPNVPEALIKQQSLTTSQHQLQICLKINACINFKCLIRPE